MLAVYRHIPFVGGSSRRRRRSLNGGFTLVEMMLVVGVLGAFSALAVPAYLSYLEKARIARAIVEVQSYEKAIDMYELGHGVLPESLESAGLHDAHDPWGTPYEYLKIADDCNQAQGGIGGSHQGGGGGNQGGGNQGGGNQGGGKGKGGGGNQGGGNQGGGNQGGGKGNGGGNQGGGNGNGGGDGGNGCGGNGNNANNGKGGDDKQIKARKDRFLVPINSDYDFYSKGPDRDSVAPLTAKKSRDDIIRANDGAFVGIAIEF